MGVENLNLGHTKKSPLKSQFSWHALFQVSKTKSSIEFIFGKEKWKMNQTAGESWAFCNTLRMY